MRGMSLTNEGQGRAERRTVNQPVWFPSLQLASEHVSQLMGSFQKRQQGTKKIYGNR